MKKTKSANMVVVDIEIFLKKKKKKHQYGCEWYRNFLGDEKQRLAEHMKKSIYNGKTEFFFEFLLSASGCIIK